MQIHKDWHAKGFRFALDDFELHANWEPLLEYASMTKVNMLDQDADTILAHQARLPHLDCNWLAERVEEAVALKKDLNDLHPRILIPYRLIGQRVQTLLNETR